MKVLLFRPDVFVPASSLVAHFVGGAIALGAVVYFFAGAPLCRIYAGLSAGAALMTPLYWAIRRARPTPSGTRLVVVLIAGAVILAVAAADCWMGS